MTEKIIRCDICNAKDAKEIQYNHRSENVGGYQDATYDITDICFSCCLHAFRALLKDNKRLETLEFLKTKYKAK